MNYQYSRKCLFIKDKDRNTLISNKAPYSIRLKIDKNKNYEFIDSVRGKISFSGRDIEDFIIIRTNGMPSYNFSCVIDDYLMKITNVIRGEEHLSNTGKQLAIYDHFS
jgi:glutamyl/glutaminyl-tRNA synthetase